MFIPDTVKNFSIEIVNDTTVTLMWNTILYQDITEYVIIYHLMENKVKQINSSSVIVPAYVSSYVISGLITAKEYVFEIRAKATFGGFSVSGISVSSGPILVITSQASSTEKCGRPSMSLKLVWYISSSHFPIVTNYIVKSIIN